MEYKLCSFVDKYTGQRIFYAGIGDAGIQATQTEDRNEAIESVKWANERHEEIKLLSLSQGFEPVLV